jgi:hypothetical protein
VKVGITREPSSSSKACIGGIQIRINIRKEMGMERSGLKRNGAEIGVENDRYADEDRTLIAAIRWRKSDGISTVTDGEAEAKAPFSRQRNVALLRSRSRGNAMQTTTNTHRFPQSPRGPTSYLNMHSIAFSASSTPTPCHFSTQPATRSPPTIQPSSPRRNPSPRPHTKPLRMHTHSPTPDADSQSDPRPSFAMLN